MEPIGAQPSPAEQPDEVVAGHADGDATPEPRFQFVTEVSGADPVGTDHVGNALRVVRHSGEGRA